MKSRIKGKTKHSVRTLLMTTSAVNTKRVIDRTVSLAAASAAAAAACLPPDASQRSQLI